MLGINEKGRAQRSTGGSSVFHFLPMIWKSDDRSGVLQASAKSVPN